MSIKCSPSGVSIGEYNRNLPEVSREVSTGNQIHCRVSSIVDCNVVRDAHQSVYNCHLSKMHSTEKVNHCFSGLNTYLIGPSLVGRDNMNIY